jgi:hypothetical protein
VPALPLPTVSNVWWPTFLVSLDERKAISSGSLPQERLDTPREILIQHTPSGPLPVTTVFLPPVTVPLEKIHYLIMKQVAVQTAANVPADKAGGIARTTQLSPQQAGARAAQPAAMTQAQIVRSSSDTSTPQTQPTRKALWFGVTSLSMACLSIILLAFTFMYPFGQISWPPFIVFALAITAFAFGFSAIQKSKAAGRAKSLAGSGIALSILVSLLEIVDRIVVH